MSNDYTLMLMQYVERVMHEAGYAASKRGQHGLAYRLHHGVTGVHGPADFLSIFGVHNWSPSTGMAGGSYRAGRWHNCVLARSPWAAAVVLASVESDHPTEELLALASVLLSTGEVEFMHRAARGEGSP